MGQIFEQKLGQVLDISRYTCQKCDKSLLLEEKRCINCGTISPKCVICLRDPDQKKPLVQMACCQSYAHETELKVWLSVKSQCPYCSSERFDVHGVEFDTTIV